MSPGPALKGASSLSSPPTTPDHKGMGVPSIEHMKTATPRNADSPTRGGREGGIEAGSVGMSLGQQPKSPVQGSHPTSSPGMAKPFVGRNRPEYVRKVPHYPASSSMAGNGASNGPPGSIVGQMGAMGGMGGGHGVPNGMAAFVGAGGRGQPGVAAGLPVPSQDKGGVNGAKATEYAHISMMQGGLQGGPTGGFRMAPAPVRQQVPTPAAAFSQDPTGLDDFQHLSLIQDLLE